MVDNYIIDQAEKRTRKDKSDRDRPRMEMPVWDPDQRTPASPQHDDQQPPTPRGVVVIDY